MPRKKTEQQLEAEIEAALQRELEEQRAARAARQQPATAKTYDGQMRYWAEYAARWGMPAAISRAPMQPSLAGFSGAISANLPNRSTPAHPCSEPTATGCAPYAVSTASGTASSPHDRAGRACP